MKWVFQLLPLAFLGMLGCTPRAAMRLQSRERERPPSLVKPDLFPAKYRDGLRAVDAELKKKGEKAEQFYVEVEERDGQFVFHLWHETAFLPQNGVVRGNPGGKCRDVRYDPQKQQIVRTLFWQ